MGDGSSSNPTDLKLKTVLERHLKCIFCGKLELQSWRMACGHLLCNECIEEIHFGSSNCPVDGTLVSKNTVQRNTDGSQKLSNMVIQCPNKEVNDCDELIPLHQLKDHFENCLENSVACPQNCGKKIVKKKLADHLKNGCPLLSRETDHKNIKSNELRRPSSGVFTDENGQVGKTDFKDNSDLLRSDSGSRLLTIDGDLSEATTYQHRMQIELLRDTVLTLEMRMDQLVRSTQDKLYDIHESLRLFKERFSGKMDQHSTILEDHFNQIQKLQLKLEDAVKNVNKFQTDKKLKSEQLSTDSENGLSPMNHSGILLWKITDYSRLKKESSDPRKVDLTSPPFYSELYGYKMCVAIDINGDGMGKGTHLSVYICLLKGPYDDVLNWPFQQKVTFILMDQSDSRDKSHIMRTLMPDPSWPEFQKPTNNKNLGRGFHKFVRHATVEDNDTYLRNDTIYLKVSIDDAIVL